MKKQRKSIPLVRSSFALALWTPFQERSAEHANLRNRCREMKEQQRKMNEDMKAEASELARYVARMKRVPEEKKVDLMNAFLTHMVERRIAMDGRQARLQEEMMKHMIQHMLMGKESMFQCEVICGMDDKFARIQNLNHVVQK